MEKQRNATRDNHFSPQGILRHRHSADCILPTTHSAHSVEEEREGKEFHPDDPTSTPASDNPSSASPSPNNRSSVIEHPFLIAQLLAGIALLGIVTALLLQLPLIRFRNRFDKEGPAEPTIYQMDPQLMECAQTCRIELVETIPQNLSFTPSPPVNDDHHSSSSSATAPLALPTFSVWMRLINEAKHSLAISAYKTSLRGKHVLGEHNNQSNLSAHGEMIYDALMNAGKERNIAIRMVENAVAKDKGDNEDGSSLYRKGALTRRILNLQRIYHTGVMHSKFIVADGRHFYLGSANLDWRSLSQKMELGVFVRNCPCLAQDLLSIFEVYWRASEAKTATEMHTLVKKLPPAKFNAQRPLKLVDGEYHRTWKVHLAASPQGMNCPSRTWDLTDIVDAIRAARRQIYVHVMDYFPMFLYSQNRRYWPHIDNAIREAIMRGVQVRIIAAALHFPSTGLRFLKSLEALGEIPTAGSVAVKIFKVPTSAEIKQSVLRRDRRTHKKFLLADDTLVIGTSNWSGDYFEGLGTGVAIVIRGTQSNATTDGGGGGGLLEKMRTMFEREWDSKHAHPLELYMEKCMDGGGGREGGAQFCEEEKDVALLTPKK